MRVVKDHEGQIGGEFCHAEAAIAPAKLPGLHVRTDRAKQMASKTLARQTYVEWRRVSTAWRHGGCELIPRLPLQLVVLETPESTLVLLDGHSVGPAFNPIYDRQECLSYSPL